MTGGKVQSLPFEQWGKLLPFHGEADVRKAVETFKAIEEDSASDALTKARAQGWRSYCYVTVLLDGWPRQDWGSGEDKLTDKKLEKLAVQLARTAKQAYPDDYDVLWAFAYARFFQKDKTDQAWRLFNRAIRQAPGEQSALLAEAADIHVYQGQLLIALQLITDALMIDASRQKQSPDWYHWVHAWVLFNAGLLAEDAKDAEVAEALYKASRKALRRMKLADDDGRFDFDALLLRAALAVKLKADDQKQDAIDKFQKRTKKLKGKDWTQQMEQNRSRYDTKETVNAPDGPADVLQRKWQETVGQLLPA